MNKPIIAILETDTEGHAQTQPFFSKVLQKIAQAMGVDPQRLLEHVKFLKNYTYKPGMTPEVSCDADENVVLTIVLNRDETNTSKNASVIPITNRYNVIELKNTATNEICDLSKADAASLDTPKKREQAAFIQGIMGANQAIDAYEQQLASGVAIVRAHPPQRGMTP